MIPGTRVRLTAPLRNPDSPYLPVEDIPVGTEGVVLMANLSGPREFHQIMVEWDNGSMLSLLPGDPYVKIS